MERWSNKIAVVTGAASGIGWSIAKELLKSHIIVVGLSLDTKSEDELKTELNSEELKLFHQRQCDLTCLEEIKSAFQWISENFDHKINILINNAGMCEFSKILDEHNEASLKRVIDVNLMAAIFCTKEAYKLMKFAMVKQEECHIINMSSLLGHCIMPHIPDCGFNLYPVAKHALRATNEVLRKEMANDKLLRLSVSINLEENSKRYLINTKLCFQSISPGITETKFGTYLAKPKHLNNLPDIPDLLKSEDIARAVMFILSSPLHVTIAEMLIVPTSEVF